jgi:hypothetical protein
MGVPKTLGHRCKDAASAAVRTAEIVLALE